MKLKVNVANEEELIGELYKYPGRIDVEGAFADKKTEMLFEALRRRKTKQLELFDASAKKLEELGFPETIGCPGVFEGYMRKLRDRLPLDSIIMENSKTKTMLCIVFPSNIISIPKQLELLAEIEEYKDFSLTLDPFILFQLPSTRKLPYLMINSSLSKDFPIQERGMVLEEAVAYLIQSSYVFDGKYFLDVTGYCDYIKNLPRPRFSYEGKRPVLGFGQSGVDQEKIRFPMCRDTVG
jgi:hypothetical protein